MSAALKELFDEANTELVNSRIASRNGDDSDAAECLKKVQETIDRILEKLKTP